MRQVRACNIRVRVTIECHVLYPKAQRDVRNRIKFEAVIGLFFAPFFFSSSIFSATLNPPQPIYVPIYAQRGTVNILWIVFYLSSGIIERAK